MAEGVAVTPRVREALRGRPLTLADYATTSGISLVLGEEVWVNAPLRDHNSNFVSEAPTHVLDRTEFGYSIFSPRGRFPARLVPVPDYYNEKNSSEEPYTAYAHTHADRVRISPIEGCGMICTFCDLPYEYAYRRKRIDGLIDAIARAVEDRALPARHALISGGTPKEEDFGFLRTVYREIPARFPDLPIDIMMVPVPGLLDLDEPAMRGSTAYPLISRCSTGRSPVGRCARSTTSASSTISILSRGPSLASARAGSGRSYWLGWSPLRTRCEVSKYWRKEDATQC